MTDKQLQEDQAHLCAAIENVSNDALKTHMLAALSAFNASLSSTISNSSTNATLNETTQSDDIAVKLREKSVTVRKPRDALFVAIHAVLLEAGFKSSGSIDSEFALPQNWDANSANGMFNAEYIHPNDESIKFALQGMFTGDKFKVHVSDEKDHMCSIELSLDEFVAVSESTSSLEAASLLRNLKALREIVKPFAESMRPAKKGKITSGVSMPVLHPSDRDGQEHDSIPSPARIPPVGGGDAFPSGLGGGNPDMLVGPNHPLFGHRDDPSQGPVPGARFDPFGPPIDPLGPSGFHRPPFHGPAPRMPFGGPGPDHLRMPRDDEADPNFGFRGRGSRGGGGVPQPFGSNYSFF